MDTHHLGVVRVRPDGVNERKGELALCQILGVAFISLVLKRTIGDQYRQTDPIRDLNRHQRYFSLQTFKTL